MDDPEELALVGAFYLYGDMTIEQIKGRVDLASDLGPLLALFRKGTIRMYWIKPWTRSERKMVWGLKHNG